MTYKQLKEEIDKLSTEQQSLEVRIDVTGEKVILIELRTFDRTKPSVELFGDWDI